MRDAVDFMSAPDPAQLEALGLDVLCYTGNARPSLSWVNDCRNRGIMVTFIQESYSSRSQEGYAAGVDDCHFAESRAKEYGHTGSIAVVVSDGSYADAWDACAYGKGWSDTATLPFFAYGAHGVIDTFYRGATSPLIVKGNDGLPGRWVPETWGPTNLIGQVVGPSPVPDSDLNHVHADYTGAAPAPKPILEEDDVQYLFSDQPGVSPAYRVFPGADGRPVKSLVEAGELGVLSGEAFIGMVKTNNGQPFQAAPGFLAAIPDYAPPAPFTLTAAQVTAIGKQLAAAAPSHFTGTVDLTSA